MNISALLNTSYGISTHYNVVTPGQTKTGSASSSSPKGESYDRFSISEEAIRTANMPPVEKTDFENMSDEEFNSFLEQSQEQFGGLPGIDDETSVEDLTEEQLSQLRQTFTEMSAARPGGPGGMGGSGGPGGMGGPGGPGGQPLSQTIEESSEEELKSILAELLEENGTLSGLEDEEITSVDDLTEEQLETAKDALVEETKTMEEEMMKRQMLMRQAISAYAQFGAEPGYAAYSA